MKYDDFSKILIEKCKEINIEINEQQAKKYYKYMNLLIEWNEKMNLTAIVEPNDIIMKHFVDSLTIQKYIKKDSKVIDVGTGAGFPGLPLCIYREDTKFILMDSLNKRIKFLDEVINQNQLKNVDTIHGRAEEIAKNKEYREEFDGATSRAVAPLNILLEYMLPFVKIGGYCICMKGSNIDEELKKSNRALEVLKGKIELVEKFELPGTDYGRNIIIIKKIGNISNKYPRKAGTPSKEPIE